MKKKRKIDVSSNSDSDESDNLSTVLKNSDHSCDSPKKKPSRENDNKYEVHDELEINKTAVQVLENENNIENASNGVHNKLVAVKSIFSIEELNPDDEIYTLQCPENYIKSNLCNKNINLSKLKQSITCNNEVFHLELRNPEKKFITLAVPKNTSGGSLIKMPLKGHIVLHKAVDIPASKFENGHEDENCDKIIFPDNIKVRHPLLGAEWKAHVDLAEEVIRKENYFKKKTKSRKDKSLEIKENKIKKLKREKNNSDIVQKKKKKSSNS